MSLRLNDGKPALVGLVGNMGAGKSTVAEILSHYGYREYGFADPLKELARRIGWDGTKRPQEHYGYRTGQVLNGRALLQELGSGARDLAGEDVWVRALLRRLDDEQPELAVVSDVRFRNEAEALRARGGLIVKILRPGYHGDGSSTERGVGLITADRLIENRNWKDLYMDVAEMLRVQASP